MSNRYNWLQKLKMKIRVAMKKTFKNKFVFTIFRLVTCSLIIFFILQSTKSIAPYSLNEAKQAQNISKGELPFSVQDIENIIIELSPIMERVAGKKIQKFPEIRIVDKDRVKNAYIEDLTSQLKWAMPERNESQIHEIAESKASKICSYMLCKYGYLDNVLYIVPGNINALIRSNEIKERSFKPILTLLIAHELTHALQNQEIDIVEKFKSLDSIEKLEALNAVLEGHALFIQENISQYLESNDTKLQSREIKTPKYENIEDQNMELNKKIEDVWLKEIYERGKKFIEFYYQEGGTEKVWKILSQPPTNTSMLFNPETYTEAESKKIEYSQILEGLERFFGDQEWIVENIDVPKLHLHSVFRLLKFGNADEIISKICHMQTLSIWRKRVCYGTISLIRVKNENYSSMLLSILERITNDNLERMKQTANYYINNLSVENLKGINADVFRKLSFIAALKNGKEQKVATVLISRGDIILEINDQTGAPKDDRFIKISEEIFRRLNEARASLEDQHF